MVAWFPQTLTRATTIATRIRAARIDSEAAMRVSAVSLWRIARAHSLSRLHLLLRPRNNHNLSSNSSLNSQELRQTLALQAHHDPTLQAQIQRMFASIFATI